MNFEKKLMRQNLFFTCVVLLLGCSSVFSQSDSKSEEELKIRANELFEADNFIEAKPIFAQLLSLYPKDLDYNYKYGATVLLTEPDREKAIKYLSFATSKSTVDPVAYFYHGLAHHLNYDFAKAVKIYSKFKTKSKAELREKFQIDRQIEMAKNGNSLLSKLNEVQVIERQQIAAKDFYRIYKTDDLDGKMVSLPEEFMSKYDKKVGLQSVVFLPNNAKEVYFASYGKKPTAGKDIYKVIRLGNDTWSEPVNIGNSINTPFDEDYAFIHPDGRTLYFASKGHNSMGGYDIFKSTYDQIMNEWSQPENLDFAFSSTADDIMFVTNRAGTIAYFASNRSTEFGQITVYKTLTERKPADLSVINGKFIVENSTEGQKAKITVIDQETKETVGMYETDSKGNYTIEIAENGGDYQFTVETTNDAPIHTGIVSIPKQDEFEVLGQELRLVGTGENQQLVIKNIFDGTTAQNLGGAGPKVSADVIRMKANLDVNFSASQLAELEKERIENENEIEEASLEQESLTNGNELAENTSSSDDEVNEQESESKNTSDQSSFNEDFVMQELESFKTTINEELDKKQKAINTQYFKGNALKQEAQQLFEEAKKLEEEGAEKVDIVVKKKQAGIKALEAAYAVQIAQDLEESVNEDLSIIDELDTETVTLKQQLGNNQLDEAKQTYETIKEIQSIETANDIIKGRLGALDENKRIAAKKLADVNDRTTAFNEEKEELDVVLEKLNSEFETASKKRKEELQKNIDATELDIQDLNYQFESMQKEVNKNRFELKSIEVEEQQLNTAMNTVNNATMSELLSEEEKNSLVEQLKTYRDNDVIAYSETNDLYTDEIENTPIPESLTSNEELRNVDPTRETESDDGIDASAFSNEAFLTINKNFQEELNSSESILDEQVQLAKKIDIIKDWNTALKSKKAKQEADLETEIDEQRRNELQSEINNIQQQIVENNRVLTPFETRLAALKNGTAQPKPTAIANASEINDATVVDESFGNLKYKQQLRPTTQTSQQQLIIAKRSLYEAGKIAKQEELTRESGYTLETAEEREAAFVRANELKKEAEQKQVEAAELFARFNLQEFRANQAQIRRANNFKEGTNSASLELANLLAEEAENFFTTAVEIRNGIEESDRLTKKEVEFQKAYDYEVLAIQKQKEAMVKLNLVSSEVLSSLIEKKTGIKTALPTEQELIEATILDSQFAVGEGLLDPSDPSTYEAVKAADNETNIEGDVPTEVSQDLVNAEVINAEPIALEQPKRATVYNEITIDTVDITGERKQLILNAQTYADFKNNREEIARQLKEVDVEYTEAKKLSEENERLRKQAIVETNTAELTQDEEEKQRLIKSAQVITQSIIANEDKIDSLNQSIQEKNILIASLEEKDNELLNGLSEAEKREYVSLAQNIIPESDFEGQAEDTTLANETSEEITGGDEIVQDETSREPETINELPIDETNLAPETNIPEETILENEVEDKEEVTEIETPPSAEIETESIEESPIELENIDVIPRQVKEAIFITLSKSESAYSDTKPIPTKEEMPSGIVYKVQVGAFRNPIPQDLFKGFAPLMAEGAPGGITRYTAGLFSSETSALAARNSIRKIGYPDAFVVAFRDGIRVSVSALRQETGEEVSPEKVQRLEKENFANDNGASVTEKGSDNSPELTEGGSKEDLGSEFSGSDVQEVVNTESVKGLFFTIQIGVFSQPVKEGTFKYENLNVVKIANNLYRYNAGIFKSVIAAGDLKNTIALDIEDAFITAYYNGKRVSLEEASRLKNR